MEAIKPHVERFREELEPAKPITPDDYKDFCHDILLNSALLAESVKHLSGRFQISPDIKKEITGGESALGESRQIKAISLTILANALTYILAEVVDDESIDNGISAGTESVTAISSTFSGFLKYRLTCNQGGVPEFFNYLLDGMEDENKEEPRDA